MNRKKKRREVKQRAAVNIFVEGAYGTFNIAHVIPIVHGCGKERRILIGLR